jgi:anaerobic dimethyl sulfoxide reductase subunit B
MQLGFFFNQTRCIGCYTCQVACKDWHDIPAGPVSLMRVTRVEKGKFPNLFVAYMVNPCFHCAEPPCLSVCPAQAISKREEDGVVTVERDKCLNCAEAFCRDICPYNSPQFSDERDTEMQKCDFCLERLTRAQPPICVDACPMRALDFGDIEDLTRKYGDIREAPGFVFASEAKPSIIFKPRRNIIVELE